MLLKENIEAFSFKHESQNEKKKKKKKVNSQNIQIWN